MVLDYAAIAGQLVADGIGTRMPLTGFETNQSIGVIKVNSLIPKLNIFIEDTKVWGNPLSVLENRKDNKYGAGMEIASFLRAAANKKLSDDPNDIFPYGEAEMTSQYMYDNYAYNIPMMVIDDEVDQAVYNAEQAGQYAAGKVATVFKAIGQHGYASYKQTLANVINGTRVYTTYDRSDGSSSVGNAVTYNKTIVGYAGKVGTPDVVVPLPVRGTPTTIEDSDALTIAKTLRTVGEDFTYEGTDYNLLEKETFSTGKPYLIMETATLSGMDDSFMMNAGFKGFPTVDARTYLGKRFDIIEIDEFPDKPTTDPVTTTRIGALVLDKSVFIRATRREDSESTRNTNLRATGYSYQCKALIGMNRGVNSYAMLVKPS